MVSRRPFASTLSRTPAFPNAGSRPTLESVYVGASAAKSGTANAAAAQAPIARDRSVIVSSGGSRNPAKSLASRGRSGSPARLEPGKSRFPSDDRHAPAPGGVYFAIPASGETSFVHARA